MSAQIGHDLQVKSIDQIKAKLIKDEKKVAILIEHFINAPDTIDQQKA